MTLHHQERQQTNESVLSFPHENSCAHKRIAMARRLDSEGWHGDSPPEAGLLESRRASPEAHGSGSDSPACVGVLRERLGVAGPLHDSAFPGLSMASFTWVPPSPSRAHGSPPAAHPTPPPASISVHRIEMEVLVRPQPVHSPRLRSAIFSFPLFHHPLHNVQGENRDGWQTPGHAGRDRHLDEEPATLQTTAADLRLLLTVARVAFTVDRRLRRKPTRWDWPKRVFFQHVRAHTIRVQRRGTRRTTDSMLSLVG